MTDPAIHDAVRYGRSWLFVPGDRPDRFDKAAASGADVVVIDLEDAVHPDARPQARARVASWLRDGHQAVVRVSSIENMHADVDAVYAPGLLGVILPKPAGAVAVAGALADLTAGVNAIVLVETAHALHEVEAIAALSRVVRLAFGPVDLAIDTGLDFSAAEVAQAVRTRLSVASAVAGLPGPIEGPVMHIDDPQAVAGRARAAKAGGMRAMLCIHPSQVAAINDEFRPSDADVARAQEIVAAADEHPGVGAFALGGRLIDKPVIVAAQHVLEAAERYAAND
jgi:citrate lyase subunit beta/citryl-CoA lyase